MESKALSALFPGSLRWLLAAAFGEPNRWWTLPELAGRAGMRPATVRLHLGHLKECGLICEKSNNGGHPRFQADPSCPVFAELQSIMTKLGARNLAGAETILIVEDQAATAQITRILLESWGYRVLETHGGAQALRAFDEQHGNVNLVLTDVQMPEMTGPQLAGELQRRKPGLPVIFMSGYPGEDLAPDCAFLPKPFNPAGLSRAVRRELDRH
jgi:CheY-like chemotaxis protein